MTRSKGIFYSFGLVIFAMRERAWSSVNPPALRDLKISFRRIADWISGVMLSISSWFSILKKLAGSTDSNFLSLYDVSTCF